ncbi:MAG: hypothetical protein OHK0039_29570 [Bacteroidia bacterium]
MYRQRLAVAGPVLHQGGETLLEGLHKATIGQQPQQGRSPGAQRLAPVGQQGLQQGFVGRRNPLLQTGHQAQKHLTADFRKHACQVGTGCSGVLLPQVAEPPHLPPGDISIARIGRQQVLPAAALVEQPAPARACTGEHLRSIWPASLRPVQQARQQMRRQIITTRFDPGQKLGQTLAVVAVQRLVEQHSRAPTDIGTGLGWCSRRVGCGIGKPAKPGPLCQVQHGQALQQGVFGQGLRLQVAPGTVPRQRAAAQTPCQGGSQFVPAGVDHRLEVG